MTNIIIKTEKDISKIKLGSNYIVDGPEDPLEFIELLSKIEPKIDSHIERLLNPDKFEQIKENYTVKELKAIIKGAGIKGYSKLNEEGLINLILDNNLL